MQFRNFNRDLSVKVDAAQLHPSANLIRSAPRELDKVVLDVRFRHLDQLDAARQPAVVPPIGFQRGDAFQVTSVIHLDNHAVLPVENLVTDFNIEWRESTCVLSDFSPIQPDACLIIRAAEIHKSTDVLSLLVREIPLVPYRPFVKQ